MSRSDLPVVAVVPVRLGRAAVGAAEAVAEAVDAQGDDGEPRVVLIGEGTAEAAGELAEDGFADLVVHLAEIGPFAPSRWAAALAEPLGDADLIVLPASVDGRDLAPRLAAVLGRPLVAGAVAVNRTRALVARASGRALAEIAVQGPVVATLQPGVRTVASVESGEPVEPTHLEVDSGAGDGRDVTVTEVLGPDAATMDLAEAPFILGAGAGLGTVEAITEMVSVADALDGSVGATRVVTDEGWIDLDRQIGTTGVVVDPRVYIAFGISGAVQHTAGLGAPEYVISVNTDAHCPMMEIADLAVVADAPAVVAELHRRLGSDPHSTEDT